MTVIVGLVDGDRVVMGADSQYSLGWVIDTDKCGKLFRNGSTLWGCTGTMRDAQVIAHAMSVPRRHPDDDLVGWAVCDLTSAMREALDNHGRLLNKSGCKDMESTFLVAVEGRLLRIGSDSSVFEPDRGYIAIGSGCEVAAGALRESEGSKLKAEERVERAVRAACENIKSVGGDVVIEVWTPA